MSTPIPEFIADNAVIRTSPRWDRMVKHLGYISVSIPRELKAQLPPTIITDRELVEHSQEALERLKITPVTRLPQESFAHLILARAIAAQFDPKIKVYAAVIPPASDRVRTAGLYDMTTQEIMLHMETLQRARTTVDAMVHELGHHIAYLRTNDPVKAEDLQPAHSEAMTYVAAEVFDRTRQGDYDELLKNARW